MVSVDIKQHVYLDISSTSWAAWKRRRMTLDSAPNSLCSHCGCNCKTTLMMRKKFYEATHRKRDIHYDTAPMNDPLLVKCKHHAFVCYNGTCSTCIYIYNIYHKGNFLFNSFCLLVVFSFFFFFFRSVRF